MRALKLACKSTVSNFHYTSKEPKSLLVAQVFQDVDKSIFIAHNRLREFENHSLKWADIYTLLLSIPFLFIMYIFFNLGIPSLMPNSLITIDRHNKIIQELGFNWLGSKPVELRNILIRWSKGNLSLTLKVSSWNLMYPSRGLCWSSFFGGVGMIKTL